MNDGADEGRRRRLWWWCGINRRLWAATTARGPSARRGDPRRGGVVPRPLTPPVNCLFDNRVPGTRTMWMWRSSTHPPPQVHSRLHSTPFQRRPLATNVCTVYTTYTPRLHHVYITSTPRIHHVYTTYTPRIHHNVYTTYTPRIHHVYTTSTHHNLRL